MSSNRVLPFAVCAALTLATACGSSDKSTGPSDTGGSTATAADVSGMMAALSALGAFSFSPTTFTGASPASPGLALQTSANYPFDVTTNCPGGGTVRVNGNYSYSISGSAYTYNGTSTETFSGCKATGNGTVYTFTGSSWTVTFNMNYNLSAGSYTYTLHEGGTINWSGSSKSGACPVDINVSVSYGNGGTPTYQYSGTYCGISVTQTA